ncbi:MAG: methyltransferase domain-containing protein [Alphaproteobacteria bacterium]
MAWDADQYLKFEDHRTRPARDLVNALPPIAPSHIVDLGCGTGTSTALLRVQFPDAQLNGIDNAPEMLAKAANMNLPDVSWQVADVAAWAADRAGPAFDLIYSNALFHWLGEHELLFPQLIARLTPGGILAVQMPRNFEEPSHQLTIDCLNDMGLSNLIPTTWLQGAVGLPSQYDDWLRPHSLSRSIWTTTYYHRLEGDAPVLNWIKGAALRPILSALNNDQTVELEARLERLLAQAYPPMDDGAVLFPFTRLFVIAEKTP